MSDPALQRWTVDQFFEWQARQTERYELVDRIPGPHDGGCPECS